MAQAKENPRYNVISARLSDEEKELLDAAMKKTGLLQSDFARDAILEKIGRLTA